ncbi:MAG: hypothetical protein ACI8YP_002115 [Algoriphagus sp.]|jgi:hypothetical protein
MTTARIQLQQDLEALFICLKITLFYELGCN